jgi:hypothetical protein
MSSEAAAASEEEDDEPKPRPLKRRRIEVLSTHTLCCTCREEMMPDLLLVGCSNRHAMCHLCTRVFASSKLVMNKFPRYFPGKVSLRQDMQCPLCCEALNGTTNMFVYESDDAEEDHDCPYKQLLPKDVHRPVGCHKRMSLKTLHRHLIDKHNQTVKCPNCSTWLCDGEKTNSEDLLLSHVLKHCQEIKCQGCDRTGNMINLFMHSTMGRDHVCDTAKTLFQTFGKQLWECFHLFEETENMTQLATMMLRWVVQYLYQRQNGPELGVDIFGKHFHRIFYAFVLQMFCHIHAPLIESDIPTLLNQLLQLSQKDSHVEYEDTVMMCTSAFAKRYKRRMDFVSHLPFSYRLIVMSLSDFQHAQCCLKRYPKTLTPMEQSDVTKLIRVYEKMIPQASFAVTFDLPNIAFMPSASEAASSAVVVAELDPSEE